ncbi:sigma-70 family RNA polymerase sigma factor [Dyadobacter sp. CY261]|uniref:RNA polymerase sigma factor n=1 Tax=Dyadobacter sp. CY261 TaxID=2907203 RepID=UPI001F2D86D7|nr:sigma-70 family RNA polymerase sigma factor [Dyadobacter sp. CY261]MCF0069400.1 sigma-70 family RNA polymerase sigma factor [Dyadobacter sp. CY261]
MTSKDSCKRYRDSDLVFYEELLHEKREAFSCLYFQTYQQCIPYVLKRGSDREQAEDLLQECLAIFVCKVRDGSYMYQEGTRITTYFHRIYINQWKKNLDQQTRRGEIRLERHFSTADNDEESYKGETIGNTFKIAGLDDDGNAFEADLPDTIFQAYDDDERSWIFRKLDRAFQLLAEDCRKVLRWFYVEDRSLRDIASELGMTEASATVKRFKCAKYLKEKFHL